MRWLVCEDDVDRGKVYRFIQGQEQEELRNVSIRILFFLRFAIASLHVYVQVEEDALSVRAEHQHAAYKATIDHSFVRVQGPGRHLLFSPTE